MHALSLGKEKEVNLMSIHRRKAKRSNKKRSTLKGRIKAGRKRETLYGSVIILGIIIVIIASGWYLLQPKSQGESSSESGQEHPGFLATGFSLTDLDGNVFQLSSFSGQVVVIDFMATWCGPCRQEMPHYGAVWEKYRDCDCMALMSIDIDPFTETEETLRSFAQEFPYATWIWAMDTANLAQAYQVTAIPKTVIIDQDGYVRFTHTGVTSASTFIQEIDQLLS